MKSYDQTLVESADRYLAPAVCPDCGCRLPVDGECRRCDQIEAYEERAAIMEFDGGLTREEAEKAARNIVTKPCKAECRHERYEFTGDQEDGKGGSFKLFTCLDCKTTFCK